MGSIIEIWH